jgi:gamma-glutamylcyclotransferase (GGCT)/AIG2-like uncharacterized protein YtfP
MTPTFPPPVEEEVFQAILGLYLHWDDWKLSKACFLSRKEILVVEYYRKYYAYRSAAQELDIFVAQTSYAYNYKVIRALNKLENYYEYYERWLEG